MHKSLAMMFGLAAVACSIADAQSPPSQVPPESTREPAATIVWRLPAEFEPQEAIVLCCNEFVEYHPRILIDVIRALSGHVKLYGLVNDATQRTQIEKLLIKNQLPLESVICFEVPTDGMWIRSYGPKVLCSDSGERIIVDFAYLDLPAIDGKTRPADDRVPAELSKHLRLPLVEVPISLEGGNLLTNGMGECVTTTQLLMENEHRDYVPRDILTILHNFFLQKSWSPVPYVENDSSRQIDAFATFTATDVVVIGSCDAKRDRQAAEAMDAVAKQLGEIETNGKAMKVVRLPMDLRGDDVIRTYTSIVFANDVVLVPQYGDVESKINENALTTYRNLLPNCKIVPIECLELAQKGGALHCVTCNIPAAEASSDDGRSPSKNEKVKP